MKSIMLLVIFTLFANIVSFAKQDAKDWAKLNYLVGNWKGDGSGGSGAGEGTFSFRMDLDKNILIRTSHSEYPSTGNRPVNIHDDLMRIYRDSTGMPNRAIYFDNESHVINYSITVNADKEIIFTSDRVPKTPRFRLTYKIIDDVTVDTIFEISKDGINYFTYIQGVSKRVE